MTLALDVPFQPPAKSDSLKFSWRRCRKFGISPYDVVYAITSYPPDCCCTNESRLAAWSPWSIEINVTMNRMSANIATVMPVRKRLSMGYETAVFSTGRPAPRFARRRRARRASLTLNTAIRMPEPTRITPTMTNAIDTLSVAWFSKVKGSRIHARLKAAARVIPARAHPRDAAAMPSPSARTGGPGIFPMPVSAAKPHTVSAIPPRATRIPATRTSRDRSCVPGSGRSRIARTMFRRLTRQEAGRIVIQGSAVPAMNAVRKDAERPHDEEEVRRIPADLQGLRGVVGLDRLDAQQEVARRDAEPQILRHAIGVRDAVGDASPVRDPDQVDRAALIEGGLRPPEVHEQHRAALVRGLARVPHDPGDRRVDDRLVRGAVEQGEILARGRVQVRRRAFVRVELRRQQLVRVDAPSVEQRQRPEAAFVRGVEAHHGNLLVPLVPRDVADRHDLQEGRRDSVDGGRVGREVPCDLGEIGFREGEELAVERVRDELVDRIEARVDVLQEDVAEGVADDEARGDDRRADEQAGDDDQDARLPPSDVPRREACEERPEPNDHGDEDDPDDDRPRGRLGEGHPIRPASPRRSRRSASARCGGPVR